MMALPDGYRLIVLDSVDSTNEEARRLAASGAFDTAAGITVIRAAEQTSGRARRGRGWESRPGNLYASLLLRPGCPAAEAPQLGFVAGVALHEAVRGMLPAQRRVACKWPNDLLVDGRKVAGMLLEGAGASGQKLDWLVIGVGVNVAHHPPATEFPATDLAEAGCDGVTPERLLLAFLAAFDVWRARWRADGFAAVRRAWLAAAHGRGGPLTVRLDAVTYSGTFADLDADGALLLEQGDGMRRVTAGDVFFAAA